MSFVIVSPVSSVSIFYDQHPPCDNCPRITSFMAISTGVSNSPQIYINIWFQIFVNFIMDRYQNRDMLIKKKNPTTFKHLFDLIRELCEG